jgi:hypothetical protein
MKDELNQIIKELKEVLKENLIYVTNETFLDAVLRIYNTEQINKQKKFYPKNEFRKEFIPSGTSNISKTLERQNNSTLTSKQEPPTKRQIEGCKRRGIIVPAGSSKQEVWRIMKEHKEKQNE